MQEVKEAEMSYPTPDEKKLITKFRSRVFDILKPGEDRSDHFLIKWIRASEGNIERAEVLLRKSFEWRAEIGADSCLDKPLDPFMMENYPFRFLPGLDSLGHPIIEIPLGSWDLEKVVREGKEEEFHFYTVQLIETIMVKIRESNFGKQPWEFQNTQFTCVADWSGYSYSQLAHWKAVQQFLRFASTFDTHYPETLYRCFYINCPKIFPKLYALLKPVISERTISKLKIYGTRREDWEPKLKRLMHTDQLSPSFCGGESSPESGHSLTF